ASGGPGHRGRAGTRAPTRPGPPRIPWPRRAFPPAPPRPGTNDRGRRCTGVRAGTHRSDARRRIRTGTRSPLADPDDLVRLQRQAPARMREAVVDGALRVGLALRAVHGLQEEMVEGERLEALGPRERLRVHELQLVAALEGEGRVRFRAHADPVDA